MPLPPLYSLREGGERRHRCGAALARRPWVWTASVQAPRLERL